MLRATTAFALLTLWLPACYAAAVPSGEQTVQEVCSACHGAGLLGAPQIGNGAAWSARLKEAGSVDGLLAVAASGRNNMPPRGGESSLSDAELRAAIEYMLARSGVR
jgi:cytochrome c5